VVGQAEHPVEAAHELNEPATVVEQARVLNVEDVQTGVEDRLDIESCFLVGMPCLDVHAWQLVGLVRTHVTVAEVAGAEDQHPDVIAAAHCLDEVAGILGDPATGIPTR
jgi:hypothetical protein